MERQFLVAELPEVVLKRHHRHRFPTADELSERRLSCEEDD